MSAGARSAAAAPERAAVVTGTSSGIGEAVARELVKRGWRVLGLSRRPGVVEGIRYAHACVDLGDLDALAATVELQARDLVAAAGVTRLALVNNAALPGLLGPLSQIDPAELLKVYTVNVAAPIWLMGWLLQRARPGAAIRIVNVSSGASSFPLPGLGAYGSSKAALRMAGMILGSELDAEAPGGAAKDVSILSFEPGIVDTPMQTEARTSPKEVLPSVAFFQQAAAEQRLVPPSAPAADIVSYLESDGHPRFSEQRHGAPPA